MFTLDQIKTAHALVKTGADFPAYLQALIALGVASYETSVFDGSTTYTAIDGSKITSEAKYPEINILDKSDAQRFASYLKSHQKGQTDFLIFCGHAAQTGVERWVVDTHAMTCTYYDKLGNPMLTETISNIS